MCREVNKAREERLRRKRENDRLRSERKTNEERHARFINLTLPYSHFNNGTSYRIARRSGNDKNRHAEQHKELREGISPLILVVIALRYSYNTC